MVGFLIAQRKYGPRVGATTGLLLPPPLNDEQYEKSRSFYIEMYRASMQQYDKLVPWAAGGALVLSTTLLHDIATASAGTRSLLGLSWLFLFLSLMGAVASHFTSSRIYSSERAAIDLLHRDNKEETRREAAAQHRIANENDRLTYWLNYV